jgi:hypothetical protein
VHVLPLHLGEEWKADTVGEIFLGLGESTPAITILFPIPGLSIDRDIVDLAVNPMVSEPVEEFVSFESRTGSEPGRIQVITGIGAGRPRREDQPAFLCEP